MNLGIVYAIFSLVSYGTSELFSKHCLKTVSPSTFATYRLFFSAITLLPLFFFVSHNTVTLMGMGIIMLISLLGTIPYFFYLKAVKAGEISIASPVAKTSTIITLLLSAVILHEILSLSQYAIVALLIFCVICISFDFKEIKQLRMKKRFQGLEFALIAAIGWGLVYFLLHYIVDIVGPFYAAFYLEAFTFVFTFIGIKLFVKDDAKITSIKEIKPIMKWQLFIAGLLVSFGSLFYTLAISVEKISLVAPIANATPLIALLGGQFIFRERLTFLQNLCGLGIVAGVILLNVI